MSELNPHGLLPCCVRFAPPVARRRRNTRYRSARYGFDRAGLTTGWTPLRGFTVSSRILPSRAFSSATAWILAPTGRHRSQGHLDGYVFDERAERSVKADLIAPVEARGRTLAQWIELTKPIYG